MSIQHVSGNFSGFLFVFLLNWRFVILTKEFNRLCYEVLQKPLTKPDTCIQYCPLTRKKTQAIKNSSLVFLQPASRWQDKARKNSTSWDDNYMGKKIKILQIFYVSEGKWGTVSCNGPHVLQQMECEIKKQHKVFFFNI